MSYFWGKSSAGAVFLGPFVSQELSHDAIQNFECCIAKLVYTRYFLVMRIDLVHKPGKFNKQFGCFIRKIVSFDLVFGSLTCLEFGKVKLHCRSIKISSFRTMFDQAAVFFAIQNFGRNTCDTKFPEYTLSHQHWEKGWY